MFLLPANKCVRWSFFKVFFLKLTYKKYLKNINFLFFQEKKTCKNRLHHRFYPGPEGLNGVKLMIFKEKKGTDHNRLQETYDPLDSNKSRVILQC